MLVCLQWGRHPHLALLSLSSVPSLANRVHRPSPPRILGQAQVCLDSIVHPFSVSAQEHFPVVLHHPREAADTAALQVHAVT